MMSAVRGLLPLGGLALTTHWAKTASVFYRIDPCDLDALLVLPFSGAAREAPNDGERQHVTEVSRQMRSKSTGSGGI
jgi:hypothetical protein